MHHVIVVCSTAHMTEEDTQVLEFISRREIAFPWVHDTVMGYIIYTGGFRFPLLEMKRRGLSESFRRFVYHVQRRYRTHYIHFDRDADILEGETTFDW